ncbi:MAG: MarR family transcriptional regulator [Candidatus Omnitrophica bacterium]|nr:MarR family transcriptional regulator [Candidatus Omnitrophota bacterium]MCB9748073.1 MarR family transcriptional regulator [Candidatus Omnitrophota bacterium]
MKNFYLDTVKGRPSAEAFNGMLCVYSLLQRKMDEYFKPYSLTPVKFNALMLIKHLGESEGMSQNEICHHLIVSPSNITRLIDRLIADGLVQRIVSEKDRRIKLIKITAKGDEILNQLFHGYGEMIQKSVYVLERSEVEDLARLLLKWFIKLNENSLSKDGGHE